MSTHGSKLQVCTIAAMLCEGGEFFAKLGCGDGESDEEKLATALFIEEGGGECVVGDLGEKADVVLGGGDSPRGADGGEVELCAL